METIADQMGCHPSQLRLQTDLWNIAVDGNDAADLLHRLSETFEINLENMQFHRHFGPEAGRSPLAVLLPGWWCWRRERIPVMSAVLPEAARARIWPIEYNGGPSV